MTTQKRHKKPIAQRVRTNLGRSVGYRQPPNWFGETGLQDPNIPTYHKSCVIKGQTFYFVNDHPIIS